MRRQVISAHAHSDLVAILFVLLKARSRITKEKRQFMLINCVVSTHFLHTTFFIIFNIINVVSCVNYPRLNYNVRRKYEGRIEFGGLPNGRTKTSRECDLLSGSYFIVLVNWKFGFLHLDVFILFLDILNIFLLFIAIINISRQMQCFETVPPCKTLA